MAPRDGGPVIASMGADRSTGSGSPAQGGRFGPWGGRVGAGAGYRPRLSGLIRDRRSLSWAGGTPSGYVGRTLRSRRPAGGEDRTPVDRAAEVGQRGTARAGSPPIFLFIGLYNTYSD